MKAASLRHTFALLRSPVFVLHVGSLQLYRNYCPSLSFCIHKHVQIYYLILICPKRGTFQFSQRNHYLEKSK